MRARSLGLAVVLGLLLAGQAATSGERGAAAVDQALRDLASDLRAVCLAAHPDDEDAETLALLRMRHGVETTVVCFTRGEGGQNEIGDELYEDLGAIRTGETRAAGEVIGARVRFLDFPDFGFSRSAEEAFERWGREEMLRRLVHAFRAIRPHLVITNHDVTGGHGHHQAVGVVALDAFDAAADPERFPDAGASWEVQKLFVACPLEKATALPDTGRVDPVRGLSFAEIGLRSLVVHRSQGTWDWVKIRPGPRVRPYRLAKSRVEGGEGALLQGLAFAAPEWLQEASRSGTREDVLGRVLAARKTDEGRRPPVEKIDRAVAAALGLTLTLELADDVLVPGEQTVVRAAVQNGGHRALLLSSLGWRGPGGPGGGSLQVDLGPGEAHEMELPLGVPITAEPNRPLREHLYDYPRPRNLLEASVEYGLADEEGSFSISREIEIPVFPPITVRVEPWGRLLRPVEGQGALKVLIENHSAEPIEGSLRLEFTDTDRLETRFPDSLTVPPGTQITVPVALVPRGELEPGEYRMELSFGGARVTERLRVMDVEIPAEVRVGVVTTYGDEHLRALEAMDIAPVAITDEDLEIADLDEFDTIVLGIRAYLARPVLARVNHRLLEFVARGGNLVVCYNKEREWSPSYSPFKIEIGRERVTREDASIDFAFRDHRLLNTPNEVSEEDFAGWVQERGLYFPSSWDEDRCEAVLRTSDPGQRLVPGILAGEHGEGTYVYTSLVWYRQLRVLNPGALKVLANMVSYPWRR
ncbi:MAG: PIG-L family deacetylase [Planctomycetota bacterium]|jgi:LmbE family N-acetylglucosaminyl deacetylase